MSKAGELIYRLNKSNEQFSALDFELMKGSISDLESSVKTMKQRINKKAKEPLLKQAIAFIMADVESLVRDAGFKKSGELVSKAKNSL